MKTKPFYLVIGGGTSRPTVRRVTARWPSLSPGEAIVRLSLELPDTLFTHPVHTVELEADDASVAVEVLETTP